MNLPALHLKPKAHTRLSRGHQWIFSNEVERVEGDFKPGDDVRVLDNTGKHRGTATYNPNTLIAARLHSRQVDLLDAKLIARRLRHAVEVRQEVYPDRSSWRAIHSEGDRLPGLIIDKLGDVVVVQILTLAMERRREEVLKAIREVMHPKGIFERSDSNLRKLEGLESRVELVEGEMPEPMMVEDPPGITIETSLSRAQKTGLYLDHHENRLRIKSLAKGARVLDVFSYVGQWSACALTWGAQSVTLIDASAEALAHAERTLERIRGEEQQVQLLKGDAFEQLRQLEKGRAEFDIIVLDPPAFAKSRKHVRDALRGYKDLNLHAMRLLAKGGHLLTVSCSHHIGESDFQEMLVKAARNSGRDFIDVAPLRQAQDHPVLLGHPETMYLKGSHLRRIR